MALKTGGRHSPAGAAAPRRVPGARRIELLASLAGFGLQVGQGWLLDKLLRQNGRLLLRVERLEAMLEQAATAPLAVTGDSTASDRVRAGPRAAFSRVSVTERKRTL